MFAVGARRITMPNSQRSSLSTSMNNRHGKNSLTFENVVCTQLELQRRAASFSHRRSTMCRPITPYRLTLLTPIASTECSNQFLKTKYPSKQSRTSSSNNSIYADRQSSISMFFWENSSRNENNKKDESRWSLDLSKETPLYWSLRSRLIEEYSESESLIEFAKKTIFALMKTKEATILLCLFLIFSIIMMGIGVSHLNDCPRQRNLPIYLFVCGIVWTTKLFQNIWQKYRSEQKRLTDEEESSSDHNDGHAFIDRLMTSFLIIWFFFGQYWFITIGYPPYFEQTLEDPHIWCEKTVVYCACISIFLTYFILITFVSITLFLVFYTRYSVIQRASSVH